MTVTRPTKSNLSSGLQTFINAVEKYLPNETLVIAGQPVKTTSIVKAAQAQIDALAAGTAAHTAWLHTVQQQRLQLESVLQPYVTAVRHYAAMTYGPNSPDYAAFGFKPPKAPQRTAKAKAQTVEQIQATRKARNVMGSKQRLAIRGVVATQNVAPAPAMAMTQSTSAPAATPANGTLPNGSSGQSH